MRFKTGSRSLRLFLAAILLSLSAQGVAQGGVPGFVEEFSLADVNGQVHRLSDYDSQPKLIMFWATWCPYCKRLFPAIQQIHADYASAGLQVLAISVRDEGDVAAYIEEYDLKMQVLVKGDEVADSLGVPGTPAVVLLDPTNQVVFATTNSDPEHPGIPQAVNSLLSYLKSRSTDHQSD